MAKRLVVCCDGTWTFADQPGKTNVTKVALSIRRRSRDGTEQRVYYRDGVGTRRWERLRGGAFGMGLSRNVLDAYRFLVHNYEPGDALYLFGFSRGAFTARSLAGLVRNSGILRPENADRIKEAWTLYRSRTKKPTGAASTLFRRAHAHEPEIHFVWDTVGALGIPVPGPRWLSPLINLVNRRWAFHDTDLSSRVKEAFHALAIDEQRSAFRPTPWLQQPGAADSGQEMKQVWFTGVHSESGATAVSRSSGRRQRIPAACPTDLDHPRRTVPPRTTETTSSHPSLRPGSVRRATRRGVPPDRTRRRAPCSRFHCARPLPRGPGQA